MHGARFHWELPRLQPGRRAFALATTLGWICAVSAVLSVAFLISLQRSRWEVQINESIDHLYFAEAVIAAEVNRLKAVAWENRWYVRGLPGPPRPGVPPGQVILGQFPRAGSRAAESNPGLAEYEGYVQDVVNFWDPSSRGVLVNHTDIFLKVRYPVYHPPRAGADPPVERHFFCRLVFRRPSTERPTAVSTRRFTGVPVFEPRDAGGRAAILCSVNEDELMRERRRPASTVLEREIRYLARHDLSLPAIAAALGAPLPRSQPAGGGILTSPAYACETADERAREMNRAVSLVLERETRKHASGDPRIGLAPIYSALVAAGETIRAQVKIEEQIHDALKDGQRALSTPGQIESAKSHFARALALARSQLGAQSSYSIPACLFALARGEWDFARTLRRDREGVERRTLIDSARAHWQEIIRDYPWRGAPPHAPFGNFPDRMEAPHAFVPLAFSLVDRADPENAGEYNRAIAEAISILEQLRLDYPVHHLWGEDAITGYPHANDPSPSTREDEVVWYEEQLLPLPVLIFGGATVVPTVRTFASILRFVPHGPTDGEWLEVNTMGTPREDCTATELPPRRGWVKSGTFLLVGGTNFGGTPPPSVPEVYDAILNRIRPTLNVVNAGNNMHRSVALNDGRVYIIEPGGGWFFDPSTETFSPAPRFVSGRADFGALRLRNGQVLAVGGHGNGGVLASGEVFDPGTNRWTPVRNEMTMPRYYKVAMVELDDGSVLMHGFDPPGKTSDQPDLFFPDRNMFWPGKNPAATAADIAPWPPVPVGRLSTAREWSWFFKRKDGSVLAGTNTWIPAPRGSPGRGGQRIEIYDPTTRTFRLGADIPTSQYGQRPIERPDGSIVLVAVGSSSVTGPTAIIDPDTLSYTSPPGLAYPRQRALVIGLGFKK